MKSWIVFPVGMLVCLCCLGWTSRAEAACEKSYLYLLLDTSGSMVGTKHTDVRTAIKQMVNNFQTKVHFGLATFGEVYRQRVPISASAATTIANTVDSYASNENYTRMGQAIYESGLYLSGLKSQEPASTKNRPYYLILITDGYPTSDPRDAQTETRNVWTQYGIKTFVIGIQFNAALLNILAQEGQTTSAYNATNVSSINNALNAIANTATQEVCDDLDNDCDGQTDEDWPDKGKPCTAGVGSCAQQGTYVCAPDKKSLLCTVQGGSAKPETCNNKDDDCNGKIDDGLTQSCKTACGSGTETCSAGKWINCTAPQPKTELCNGKDDNCDGQIDEAWPNKGRSCEAGQGICKRTGIWQCKADGSGVECNAQPGPPQTEICDDLDNDCDGQIDEDWPNKGKPCSAGTGKCQQQGVYVCQPNGNGVQCSAPGGNPSPEVCDGLDNDCNGTIDDNLVRTCQTACGSGVETCQAGKWVNCTARQPAPEQCNGQDDNCDGKVDEGLTRVCETKCGKGKETCVRGRWDFCDAPQPEPEICDGKDNDCNGQIDDLLPKPCNGACGNGEAVCQNGKWSGCSGPQPEPEICDGKDNDCDGVIDNNVTRSCRTACGGGTEICTNGTWGACSAPLPQPEICNGKDDNCDGTPDDNAICPDELICHQGQCVGKCRNGECKQGLQCVQGLCVGETCRNITCPTGQTCLGGRCLDPCSLVKCAADLVCSGGQCVRKDCYFNGCPSGKRCVNGLCEDDPCTSKQCASNEFCRAGTCVPSCATVTCNDTETCVDGKCQADPRKSGPCSGVTCPAGQYCEGGKCLGDPCSRVTCSQGRACVNGQCTHNDCHSIQCPTGQTCQNAQCVKPTSPDPSEQTIPSESTSQQESITGPDVDSPTNPNTDTDDPDKIAGNPNQTDDPAGRKRVPGCACDLSPSSLPWLPIFLLAFSLLVLIRRRT